MLALVACFFFRIFPKFASGKFSKTPITLSANQVLSYGNNFFQVHVTLSKDYMMFYFSQTFGMSKSTVKSICFMTFCTPPVLPSYTNLNIHCRCFVLFVRLKYKTRKIYSYEFYSYVKSAVIPISKSLLV